MKVLLSIKPEFAWKIFSGEKLYEYRKVIFQRRDISTVIVYATMPVGRIIGEFDIDNILEGTPQKIWNETQEHSGISKSFFAKYFSGRKNGFAIKVGNTRKYEDFINPFSIEKNFIPPQSFRYILD